MADALPPRSSLLLLFWVLLGSGCGGASRHISPPPLPGRTATAAPSAEARALYLRGQVYLLQGDGVRAQAALARAVLLDPQSPTLQAALAEAAAVAARVPPSLEPKEEAEDKRP